MATVVSLGVHIVDALGWPVSKIPFGQGIALLDEIRITVAGTAAGAAVDMAKLGLDVAAMGAIGKDMPGAYLVDTMRQYGIDTTCLVQKPGVQTSMTILPIRLNGERPALHVVGANGEFTLEDVDLEAVAAARFLHLGGTPLMPKFDGKPAACVLRFAREGGVVTLFDLLGLPQPDLAAKVAACLPYVDFFMPNYEEAGMLTGLVDRRDILRRLLDGGATHVALKCGAGGSCIGYYEKGNGALCELRTPSFQVPVVDSTGCGDAWNSGFIKGLSLGWDLERSARLGCACGGLVIQGLGSDAGIVNFEQTLAFAEQTGTLPFLD